MPDLRTDLEAFRDEWLAAASASAGDPPLVSLCRDIASRLTALLAKHAAPAAPDLRAMVLALRNALKAYGVHSDYCDYWKTDRCTCGLDDMIDAAQKAAASAAPKEWRGPWKCDRCSREFHKPLALHYPGNITTFGVSTAELCAGTLVPYERRKGGGW